MSAVDLIARLRDKGIRIRARADELELDAPKGALTEDLRDEIVQHKGDLLRLLSWSRRSEQAIAAPLALVSRDRLLPLSWAQQRLWFLDQLEPGSSAYNISWTVRLKGDLDASAMQAALQDLVGRHETLRTCFPADDGVPRQSIAAHMSVELAGENLRGAAEERLRARLQQLAATHFDLERGPLLRVSLLSLGVAEHILLVVIHHIVADGASMRIMFRELAALYEARVGHYAADLPELPVQYADYAIWQRNWLDGGELQRQTDFWLQRLHDSPPLLELPWDRPRSAAMRYRGASVLRVLPGSLAADLRRLSREHGCTLFMTMLAAFYVLLQRYAGREDLIVGTPLGGRSRTALEGLIGFFINTVVLRADLSGDPGFDQLLHRVREISLDAHANQDVPFEKLVEELQPQRELSYSPVFQVMFDLQEEPRWKLPVRDLEVIPEVVFSSRTSSFDLTLSVRQATDGLDAMFEYDTDLFDEASIERMAGHYQTLLESVVLDASQRISSLPLVDPATERRLVHAWHTAAEPYPAMQTIAGVFEAVVERQPDAPAVWQQGAGYSYAELNRGANRVADQLRSLGAGRDVPVALLARRCPETFMAALGILKAGSCVVPLDPAYPPARLRFMLADSGALALLHVPADADRAAALGTADLHCLVLDAAALTGVQWQADNPEPVGCPDDLAYLMYTSGTTGHPKGVELAHRGFVNYVTQLGRETEVSANDRILQFASPSFDIAVEESLTALLHGATLVLRSEAMSYSLPEFIAGCEAAEISWLSLPTAWWHELAAGLERGEISLPASLRCVVIGGEKAELEAFRKWRRHAAEVRLFNTYGPTEASVAAAWCELTYLDPAAYGELPIGHPVPNTRVWVMDDRLRPVPPGLPGEICIGGVGIARSYRGRPELSASRFVAVELPDGTRERLYRTGDRARYRSDGSLIFLGRSDGQLKLRGHRVEPAEIEAVLSSLPDVGRCAVLPHGEGAATLLVAYITGTAATDQLRAELQRLLPDYMIPAVFMELPWLPFTENGKLDRAALPPPDGMRGNADDFVAPRTPTEVELARIWSEVLGVTQVGVHDDFFALGGHSLVATRVMARARESLGAAVELRALFDNPTIAALAGTIDASAAGIDEEPVRPRPADMQLAPLSWSQQRLWLLDKLEPATSAFNLYSAVRITGSLREEALQGALDRVVARHEALRTVFAEHDGEPVQVTSAALRVPLHCEDLPDADTAAVLARLAALTDVPFNLAGGPLLRAHLLRVSQGAGEQHESVLLLLMHHIVSDGWSVNVLFRELGAFYRAHVTGTDAAVAELAVQYPDYAVWQHERMLDERMRRQEDYWQTALADAPPLLELPADRPRPAVQSYRGAWISRHIDRDLLDGLREFAAAQGCTLFMVLLTAFKALLARQTGRTDIIVGTPVAGRTRTELEPLIGFFLNTLVLRTELGPNPSFGSALLAVRETAVAAFGHQELPFEKLLELLQPVRSTAHTPVVQVMFNLHSEAGTGLELDGLTVQTVNVDRAQAKFDLSVALAETRDGLRTGFEYNTDLFDAATVAGWLDQFELLLRALLTDSSCRIADVRLAEPPAVPVPEQDYVPFAASAYPHIMARFTEIAARHGARAAVSSGMETVTYRELDARARGTGQALVADGAKPGERVALLLGHDASMLAGLLGVLSAGCCYIPLDRNAPRARLDAIVAASGATRVVTDASLTSQAHELADGRMRVLEVAGRGTQATAWSGRAAALHDLAYVLFTSGTTGAPKGVMQTHANVLGHAAVYTDSLHIAAGDRLSLLPGYGFDAAVMDIFGALLNGACLHPVDLTACDSPAQALDALAGVSVLHCTPTVFRYLFLDADSEQQPFRVRFLVLGGEEALAADFELFRSRFAPGSLFVNGYGPTESTLAAQFFAGHETHLPGRVVPIGTAVPGTEILLLDAAGEPAGNEGEIVIRSSFLSSGYLGDPGLTASRFTDAGDAQGVRLYRSGDRARRLPDGRLVYAGRLDAQIKIRGYRVEPGDIEAALNAADGVKRCAVVCADGQLRAYFEGTAETRALRRWLLTQLPVYMLPETIVRLTGIPLGANGKIDRAQLRMLAAEPERTVGSEPPRTPVEEQLAAVWIEVLGLERVGVHDDFFGLGGHSLLAMRLLARLRDQLGVRLTLRDLFGGPTIAELAELVLAGGVDDSGPQLRKRDPDSGLPPLSWSQQRLWFLDQLEPDSAAYNLHWAGRLLGSPDKKALQTALHLLVERHESLRTSVQDHGGEPVQLIARTERLQLQIESMPGAGNDAVHTRLLELVRRPFDLRRSPLLRAYLLETSASEAVLLFVMHHIVSDGWSMGVLFREFGEAYAAAVEKRAPALPELPLHYADFAVWQRAWLAAGEQQRQQAYWQEQLRNAPPLLELPLDRPRPPVQRYRGAWASQQIDLALLEGLRDFANDHGATLFMVLLTAFKALILRHTGRTDVLVGAPVAGRSRTELEGLLGFFLNTLVLRTRVAGELSFRELLARVRTTTLDAYDHQDLPFEKLLEMLQPSRTTAHTPLVQVTFNLHNEPAEGLALAGLAVKTLNIDRGTSKFDLSMAAVEGRTGLHVGVEYNTDLFDPATITLLLRHYAELLVHMVARPDAPVGELDLSGAGQVPRPPPRRAVRSGIAPARTLAERFATVAAEYPDRPAVGTAAEIVSYRELNERANAVACDLSALTGGPGQRVGLLFGHDAAMLTGLLATVKAGCAYVPLDPAAPPARLRAVLADADVAALLTDSRHASVLENLRDVAVPVLKISDVPRRARQGPLTGAGPDDPAYVLFTSGSTGAPKGVLQTQRNVLHHVEVYAESLQIGPADRLTLLSAYGFDAAVMDIFGALLNGACLYPLDIRAEEYPGELLDRMSAARITVLHATPTVFRYLMRSKVCRHELDTVRAVVLGGEEARSSDFELFRKQFAPPALFVNGLGPTECTLAAQFFADHDTRLPGGMVPIGRAVRGVELELLDAQGRPAALEGELGVRSAYVARGYWQQPELTAARFLRDPAHAERTLYLTGDRARRMPDGQLLFLGRTDEQVKVRGHRVEPGEIEAALLRTDGVQRAAVILHTDEHTGVAELLAYVVGTAQPRELRKALKQQVPDYMVPAAFVTLERLPLTPNGKLDISALPAPRRERALDEGYTAPNTETERELVLLWSDVLGVPDIGIHDDFFELGGHSLLAAQLAARMNESMQVVVPLRRLFDAPTVAQIAEHIDTLRWAMDYPGSDQRQ